MPGFSAGRILVGAFAALLATAPFLKWYTIFGSNADGTDSAPLTQSARGFEALPAISTILLIFALVAGGLAIASASAVSRQNPNVPAPLLAVAAVVAGLFALLVIGSLINAPTVNASVEFSFPVDYRAEGTRTPGIYLALVSCLGLVAGFAGMWKAAFAHGSPSSISLPSLPRTSPGRRKCPDCAETVLAEARVCKHCGYRFPAT